MTEAGWNQSVEALGGCRHNSEAACYHYNGLPKQAPSNARCGNF